MADSREIAVWSNHAQEGREQGRQPFTFNDDSWYAQRIKSMNIDPNGKIIDIGCGPGFWRNLWKDFNYTGYDQNAEMIRLARELPSQSNNVNFICGNNSPVPDIIPDSSFDVVWTSAVLQHNRHYPDKENLAKHIHRILKPGGYYFCTENTFRDDNKPAHVKSEDYYGHKDFSDGNSFTSEGWKTFMKSYGFKLLEFHLPSEYLYII